MLILIAGPYRSGTNDDQKLMRQNLSKLESVALPLFRKGHIPMIGEWVALPLIQSCRLPKARRQSLGRNSISRCTPPS